MPFFSKYWSIFKLSLLERMAYRLNFFMEILSEVLSSLIVIFLWLAVYRSAGRGIIGGYSLEEMMTYLLGCGLINTFILTTAENSETSYNIQEGTLSQLLLQPISPYQVWLIRDFGGKVFYFLLGIVSYAAMGFFFRRYLIAPPSVEIFLAFCLSLLLAVFLQFLFFQVLNLLSFWVENTYGIRFTMRVIMEVLGGAIIPLSFFPPLMEKIVLWLPFPYLIYFPMRIYLGKIPPAQVMLDLLREGIWIAGLSFLNWAVWKKGARQYVSMGD